MTIEEAEKKCREIEKLAREIEEDKELQVIEPRYRIMAKWIDTDISCCYV